mmetsp:Transcript_16556/g.27451  ORF Transcript_16556/g.27451 Transcript_16556/m.27451 type:complete len:463 (+) Transcript_16556:61-1449(+)
MVATRNQRAKPKREVKKPKAPVKEESESEMEVEEPVEEVEEESSEEESGDDDDADADMNADSEEEDGEDDDDDAEANDGPVTIKPVASATGEQCTFDLRNLLALNSHQVEAAKLYSKKSRKGEEDVTIPGGKLQLTVNEDHLLEKATDGCTQLINALWQLPTERSDTGPLVLLPGYSETLLPRQLPPPPPKRDTKWEKFAKERGIPLNKEKRSQKVWDEVGQDWKYRHGYNKANNDSKEWPIMEVGGNDDPFDDPWERLRDAKKARVDKNLVSRMRNEEHAGILPRGTARRAMKNIDKSRKSGKAGGTADRDNVIPVGVPVDLEGRKGSADINSLKRGRDNTQKALLATQRSTASIGKFDAMREGEPERKKTLAGLKKRKFQSATDKKVTTSEADRGMKLLNAVINGGGKAREKAKRKGALAKGETAYDYEFDDGLGPATFKKKKGRAGAGKMKKMTKKRVK